MNTLTYIYIIFVIILSFQCKRSHKEVKHNAIKESPYQHYNQKETPYDYYSKRNNPNYNKRNND